MSLEFRVAKRLGSFDLDVALAFSGSANALFGPSGAGKSTIIKAIAGLVTPDSGRIVLDGKVLFDGDQGIDLPVHERAIGLVFQDARLFPHLSVAANLGYGARQRGGIGRADVQAMAELLGIAQHMRRRPSGLSGGEAQRVAIGRALLSRPRLLLLDEPLAGLDQARREDILALLQTLREGTDVPMLHVSHQREEVLRLASDVVLISEGRCVDQGPPSQLLGMRAGGLSRRVSARLVSKSSADGLSELALSGGRLLVPQVQAPLGTILAVQIEARDVALSLQPPVGLSALNVLACDILSIRQSSQPAAMDVLLACGSDEIAAQITRRSVEALGLTPGQRVHAIIKSVALAQTSGAMQELDA